MVRQIIVTTDGFSTKDLLRVIQSIPSPKAEPFKLWLAEVGNHICFANCRVA